MSPSRQTSAAAIGVSHHKCQGGAHRADEKKCILHFAAAALDERTFSLNGRVIVCRAEISLEEFADVRGVGFPWELLLNTISFHRSFVTDLIASFFVFLMITFFFARLKIILEAHFYVFYNKRKA